MISNDYAQLPDGSGKRKNELQNTSSLQIVQAVFHPPAIEQVHLAIAEHLFSEYTFATMRDTGEVYYYKDGVYLPGGESIVQEKARSYLGSEFSTHKVNEILNWIRYKTYQNRDDFDRDKNIINLRNGLLNIETNTLENHTPKHLSIVRIPVAYQPDATCPRIERFLQEVMTPEDIPVIEEMVGFCLLADYKYHKAFLLQGSGRNGKSTLLNLIQKLLGRDNCSNMDLVSLCHDKFASSQLFGKLVNIYSDLPAKALEMTGMFKALVGQDSIPAQEKFKKGFSFTNYAKLIFSCNYVPLTYDLSPAFFARWIIIRFPRSFEGDNSNPNLLKELTTDEELSGFLNPALRGLQRLLVNGKFSYAKTTEEVADEYQRLSNPVSAFRDDCLEEDPEGWVAKDELYTAFKVYCKGNGFPVYSEKRFVEWLKKETTISECCKSIDGQQKRGWQGIKPCSPSSFSVKD